ncbi:MAG: pseudouridine synthase [Eubacteriales bacterium]|nr:pseudouridine synthase [Eubacteriales bacterium]
MRLDKLLSQSGALTRSEARRLIRAGQATVDGAPERDPGRDVAGREVRLAGKAVEDEPYQYMLLHKPAGVLTAARDSHARTVMDLVPEALARRDVLPVGRLDKDTTGALLLTNDGELAHRLLAPKRHVRKEYHATVDGPLGPDDVRAFAEGVNLGDFVSAPAEMRVLDSTPEESRAVLWLTEGKFHQVKRMFEARGRTVTALHRAAFGPLTLDGLSEGEYRPLTVQERGLLRAAAELEE